MKRKTIEKICRLLNFKCFVCKKTKFVIDPLFDCDQGLGI